MPAQMRSERWFMPSRRLAASTALRRSPSNCAEGGGEKEALGVVVAAEVAQRDRSGAPERFAVGDRPLPAQALADNERRCAVDQERLQGVEELRRRRSQGAPWARVRCASLLGLESTRQAPRTVVNRSVRRGCQHLCQARSALPRSPDREDRSPRPMSASLTPTTAARAARHSPGRTRLRPVQHACGSGLDREPGRHELRSAAHRARRSHGSGRLRSWLRPRHAGQRHGVWSRGLWRLGTGASASGVERARAA